MSDQGQDQERTEKATPFKLKEARKRGQVSKSMEVNSLLMMGGMLFLSYAMAKQFMLGHVELSRQVLGYDPVSLADPEGLVVLLEFLTVSMLDIYWPIIAVIILISIIGNVSQTGPVFSFFPLKPDIQRLNPISGFKRIFSKRIIYELIKTIIKLTMFVSIAYIVITGYMSSLLTLVDVSPDAYALKLTDYGRGLAAKMLIAVLLVALLDLMYSRWDFMQQMRMSHRDIKDEHKRREGDPLVQSRRRELQREAAKRSGSMNKVPDADVLITNPTRLAIALKFDRETMVAPTTIAKGSGDVAKKMRELARRHHVPIVENKSLARTLFVSVDIDQAIPEKVYPSVAKIYAWISDNKVYN